MLGPEFFEELRAHHREMASEEPIEQPEDGQTAYDRAADDYHPSKLPLSQALRHKMEHLDAITHLTHQFGGKVLDISTNNVIVEV